MQTSKAPPLPPQEVLAWAADHGSSPNTVDISWVPAQQGTQEAVCVSYEVEATTGPSSLAVRQTCAGRITQMVLTGLQPGATYSVKVRGVGADGAGHGAWSHPPAKVSLRALRPAEVAAARSAAASGASVAGGEPAAKAQKRRGERSTGALTRTTAVVKTAVGKGPPKKGMAVSRFIRQYVMRPVFNREHRIALVTGLAVLIVCMAVLNVYMYSN